MPQIKVGDNVYDAVPLDSITLRELAEFRRVMADVAPGVTFNDIEAAGREIDEANAAAQQEGAEPYDPESHPLFYPMAAVNLWVALKHEGVSLDDVLDMDLRGVEFIPDPEPEDTADPQ